MTPKQAARRMRIEAAAYEVLSEAGYNSASLLSIAKRANASNETLYNWYGNKQGLFRTLVESNAREATELLRRAIEEDAEPVEALEALGPVLLALVTGERAIMLNRAAAGDVSDTGTLGQSIAAAGRDTIAPLVRNLLRRAQESNQIECNDIGQAADTYFALLIGDLQIRRAIGVLPPLTQAEIADRAERAFKQFVKLFSP